MSEIWGTGYGAITQLIKETGNLVKDGEPNITTYGDFLPLSGWKTQNGILYLQSECYFDTAISKGTYTQMIFHNVLVSSGASGSIKVGTKARGSDIYSQSFTASTSKEIKLNLSDYPDTFYLLFGINANTYMFQLDNITLI